MPTGRRPQINFQVPESMKALYDEVRACGHWATRWCAAGFLLMVERPDLRVRAFDRLREWEAEFEDADPGRLREFVADVERAMSGAAPESRPGRAAPKKRKKAGRAGS